MDKDHSNLVKLAEDEPDLNAIPAFISPGFCVASTTDDNGRYETLGITHLKRGVFSRSTLSPGELKLWDKQGNVIELMRRCALLINIVALLKDSLSVDDNFERYESVETAHEDTFGWVFQPNSTGLQTWLEDESSLF